MDRMVRSVALWLLVASATGWASGLEQREAELAAAALAAENEALRVEIARLAEQARQLTLSLAQATAELDMLRAGQAAATPEAPARTGSGVTVAEMSVLDVNPELRMVVVSAGALEGLRSGVSLAVLRDRQVVARVRVVDVRPRISGAVFEDVKAGLMPVQGDRVILAR